MSIKSGSIPSETHVILHEIHNRLKLRPRVGCMELRLVPEFVSNLSGLHNAQSYVDIVQC